MPIQFNRPHPRRRAPGRPLAAAAAITAVAAALTLAACQPAVPPAAAAAGAAGEPPPVPVTIVSEGPLEAKPTQVARVEAAQRVDLQPQVAGQVTAVLFREGDLVRAGQALFHIDPRPFEAAVARAAAEVELAQAREALTHTEAERARQLARDAAIAAEELERRVAAHAEARARKAAADAALRAAQLDLEFSTIRAPISGRIGRALVTAGNYVDAGARQAPLATIVSVAPLHVHFDVADPEVLRQAGSVRERGRWQARILDAAGRSEIAQAPVDFADNEVVAGTGTLRLRARLDAPPAGLLPGQFVRVQLHTGARQNALLVPDKAIGSDQGRRFVLVVDGNGEVVYRPVDVGLAQGAQRIVTAGLNAGEQVIVSGLMRVKPGMRVKPQPAAEAAAAAPAKS